MPAVPDEGLHANRPLSIPTKTHGPMDRISRTDILVIARGRPTPPCAPTDRSCRSDGGSPPGRDEDRSGCHNAGSSHPARAGSPFGPTGGLGQETEAVGLRLEWNGRGLVEGRYRYRML
jgi:hypothetical protein